MLIETCSWYQIFPSRIFLSRQEIKQCCLLSCISTSMLYGRLLELYTSASRVRTLNLPIKELCETKENLYTGHDKLISFLLKQLAVSSTKSGDFQSSLPQQSVSLSKDCYVFLCTALRCQQTKKLKVVPPLKLLICDNKEQVTRN